MSKKTQFTEWSEFDYLDNEKSIESFMQLVIEENDPKMIALALGTIAKARGINKMAEELGIDRELLYKTPTEEAEPEFRTIYQAINKLGFEMNLKTNKG